MYKSETINFGHTRVEMTANAIIGTLYGGWLAVEIEGLGWPVGGGDRRV